MKEQEILDVLLQEINKQTNNKEFYTAEVLINVAKKINSKIWK